LQLRRLPRRGTPTILPMLVHTVYFWLKPELTAPQCAEFRKGVESLGGIKAVKAIYVGTPAKTPKRPIIDDSYSFALTVVCDDLAGHDAYQVDPLHLAFVERFKTFWNRVQIYDAD
jgi:hypothetical protein